MYLLLFLCYISTRDFFSKAEVITLIKDNTITCVLSGNDVNSTVFVSPPTKLHKTNANQIILDENVWEQKSGFYGIVTDERWEDFELFEHHLDIIDIEIDKRYGFSYCGNDTLNIDVPAKNFSNNFEHAVKPICEQWKQYYMRVKNKTSSFNIQILEGNNVIEEINNTKLPKNLTLSSKGPSLWKLHNVTYFKLKNSSTCFNLPIEPKSEDFFLSLFIRKSQTKWVKIETKNYSTIKNNKQEISGLAVHPRKIRLYNATLENTSEKQNYICKLLDKPAKTINKICDPGYIGSNCSLQCKTILNEEHNYCQGYKICTESTDCFCAWGYTNPKCIKACEKHRWGADCGEECDKLKCTKCDPIFGCTQCQEGFTGKQCNDKLPVLLKEAVVIKNISNEFVEILIKNLEYDSMAVKPDSYLVQYKATNSGNYRNLSDAEFFPPNPNTTKQITNLTTDKESYKIRIVLLVANNFSEIGVPETYVYKRSLKANNVTTTTISLEWDKHYESYVVKYECQQYWCKNKVRNTNKTENNNFTIKKLASYTQCSIFLYSSSKENENLIDFIEVNTEKLSNVLFPRNITLNETGSIEVHFKNCNHFKEPVMYKFIWKCISEWCRNNSDSIWSTKKEYYKKKENQFPVNTTLTPYTEYNISVEAILSTQPNSTIKSDNIFQIKTYPGYPGQIKNLKIFCKYNTICLKWEDPYPPTGEIEYYSIKYGNNKPIHLSKDSHQQGTQVMNCEIVYQEAISNITVQVKNFNFTDLGNPVSLPHGEIRQAPKNLHLLPSTSEEISLKWTHNFLKDFNVSISSNNSVIKNLTVTEEHCLKNYNQTIQINNTFTNVTVSVVGLNNQSDTANGTILKTKYCFGSFSLTILQFCFEKKCELFVPKHNFTKIELRWTLGNNTDTSMQAETDDNENYYWFNKIPDSSEYTIVVSLNEQSESLKLSICEETFAIEASAQLLAILCLTTVTSITTIFLCYLCIAYKYRKYPFDIRPAKAVAQNKRNIVPSPSTEDLMDFTDHYRLNNMKSVRSKYNVPIAETEILLESNSSKQGNTYGSDNVDSLPIKIKHFEDYLMDALGDDLYNNKLTKQYKKLQNRVKKSCSTGLSNENCGKNRYKNLTAYDETRVILKNNGDSDYINANYIGGYDTEKAFIAAQAPLKSTIADFWWMIWQENVTNIFMLTELVENGTVKCEQYWPDLEQKIRYGKILIENMSVKPFSDYILRQLLASCNDQTRIINHLQYTTWPDHGVPLYPQNFTPFLKRLLAMPQKDSPILVHCNAGCGRTGTLIISDIVLRMAAKEQIIDFVTTLLKLREQRKGLVNNANQYVFAHTVVYECLFGKDFSIPIDDNFQDEVFKVLRKITVKPVMEHLDKVMVMFNKQQSTRFSGAISEENKSKNRFSDILPGHRQIYLPIYSESPSSYINAVSVDCYRCPKKFIVTQQPLPNTVEDFWKLIKEFEINTIVNLNEIGENDQNCPQFWKSFDHLTKLQQVDEIEERVYAITKLRVIDKIDKTEEKTVNILRMKNWKRETPHPQNPKDLIMVWKEMFNNSWKGNSQIIVTCYDGATASGLFVALAYLLEKINYEQSCDVFSAIRTVRHSREKFVQDWAQIEFLYKAAKVYIEDFDNYDNFTA